MAALAAVPAFLAANAGTIGTIATVASTALGAYGSIQAGQAQAAQGAAQQQAAEFQAKQLDIQAKEEQGAAQLEAAQLRRQKNLALSKLQARAAGSGFTATDPTALALADEIEKYGTLQEQMAQYGGKSRRRGYEAQAAATRQGGQLALQAGKDARSASYLSAGGTILAGASTLAGRYAKKAFNASPSGGTATAGDFRYG